MRRCGRKREKKNLRQGDVVESLKKYLANGNLILFVGAGISVSAPASLPLARELTWAIGKSVLKVAGTAINKQLSSRFKKAVRRLRLEVVLQVAQENSGSIDTLLDLFREGEPNENHLLIGELASMGQLKAIVTTNFDLLIEKALFAVDVPFNVYATPFRFRKAIPILRSAKRLPSLPVIKLHGSVDAPRSIVATLTRVARKEVSDGLRRFFNSLDSNWAFLFLGYSLGDDFDINPVFHSSKKLPLIFFAQHGKSFRCLDGLQWPFLDHVTCYFQTNTTRLLRILAGKRTTKRADNKDQGKPKWKAHIAKWAGALSTSTARIIAAGLMYEASEWTAALALYRKISKSFGSSPVSEAVVENNIGTCYFNMEKFQQAKPHYERAISLMKKKKGDRSLALANLAHILAWEGHINLANKLYKKGASIAEEQKRYDTLAAIYVRMAILEHLRGRYMESVNLSSRALKIASLTGNPKAISQAYGNLATALLLQGELKKALAFCERDSRLALALGQESPIAQSHINWAQVLVEMGDYKGAVERLDIALRHAVAIRNLRLVSSVESCIGLILYRAGKTKEALNSFRSSLTRKQRYGDNKGEVELLRNVAACYLRLGRTGLAQRTYNRALQFAEKIGFPYDVAECLGGLGLVKLERKHFQEAVHLLTNALRIYQAMGCGVREAMTLNNVGVVHERMSNWKESALSYKAAAKKYKTLGLERRSLICRYRLALLHSQAGDNRAAEQEFRSVLKLAERIGEKDIAVLARQGISF